MTDCIIFIEYFKRKTYEIEIEAILREYSGKIEQFSSAHCPIIVSLIFGRLEINCANWHRSEHKMCMHTGRRCTLLEGGIEQRDMGGVPCASALSVSSERPLSR